MMRFMCMNIGSRFIDCVTCNNLTGPSTQVPPPHPDHTLSSGPKYPHGTTCVYQQVVGPPYILLALDKVLTNVQAFDHGMHILCMTTRCYKVSNQISDTA
jgi:hypothetical protein